MKYILNWPSGGGGDFIIALIALTKEWKTEIIHLPRLNLWNHMSRTVLDYRTFKIYDEIDKHIKMMSDMPDDHIMQTHELGKIEQIIINDNNISAINIYASDIYQEAFMTLMHNIKTVYAQSSLSSYYMPKENEYIESATNIDFNKLYALRDETEINLLFNAFDTEVIDMTVIKKAIELYHNRNIRLMHIMNDEDTIDRLAFSPIESFDDLIFSLEQPLRKTIDEQISLRDYLPSTGFKIK